MSTRVTPEVFPLGEERTQCPHGVEHEGFRNALEFLLEHTDGTWPGFRRVYAPDGFLRALEADMRCGCTFLAVAFP